MRRLPATAVNDHQCDYDFGFLCIAGSAILVLPQNQNITGGKISGFERKALSHFPSAEFKLGSFDFLMTQLSVPGSWRMHTFRIQSTYFRHVRFRIQNIRGHDQTGMFSFRIRRHVCKRHNQSGTKTFRIHHESGTISSSVNLVLVGVPLHGNFSMSSWYSNLHTHCLTCTR